MKNLIKLLIVSFLTLQLTSCTKEADKTPAVTKTQLITAKVWLIDEAIISPFTIYKKGAKENLYDASKISLTFKEDGTITATDLQGNALAGKWSFNADETKITLPAGLPFSEVVVDQLTATNFDLNVPTFEYAVLGSQVKGKLVIKMVPKV